MVTIFLIITITRTNIYGLVASCLMRAKNLHEENREGIKKEQQRNPTPPHTHLPEDLILSAAVFFPPLHLKFHPQRP